MKNTTGLAIIFSLALISLCLFIGYSGSPISNASEPISAKPIPTPQIKTINQYEVEIRVNEYRSAIKLRPLLHDPKLCEWSTKRSQEIKENWSHDGYILWGGRSANSVGYVWNGENLSKDYSNEVELLADWSNSPSHKENMVNPNYTHTCVRCSDNYCVQLFGGK